MEYNAWGDPPNPPEHEVNLVFTRMLAGPMDYTPGVLSLTGANGKRIQSTIARQLALYVVLYSPIQMAADLPENYARFIGGRSSSSRMCPWTGRRRGCSTARSVTTSPWCARIAPATTGFSARSPTRTHAT